MKLIKRWAVATILAALGGVAVFAWAQGPDTDGDGMSDAYEMLFGLDPNNPNDAGGDPDGEGLVNLQESNLGTDPYVADTDQDGWSDAEDSNALSRVVIRWGDPAFTVGDEYAYPGPAWWLGAAKDGGHWLSNPPAFHVGADETDAASLFIFLDRAALTTDVRLATVFFDHPGGQLFADLVDSNAANVASNLYGNFMTGGNVLMETVVSVPLEAYPDAAAVQLRRGAGEVTVYMNRVYVDRDGDGLDDDQEAQLGTSDLLADRDGDGTADGAEVLIFGTDPANPFSAPGRRLVIGAGEDFSLFAPPSGQAWAWGQGGQGQLGIGISAGWTSLASRVRGPGGAGYLEDVAAVDGGWNFSVALKGDGTVWAWGANGNGRLGDGTITERTTPVWVHGVGDAGFLSNVVNIAAGEAHGLAVLADGTVAAWGDNGSGQLGDNTTTTRKTPVLVPGAGGTGLLSNVVAVAAGRNFSFALAADGAVWAWGANAQNQLGDADTTMRKTPVRVHGPNDAGYLSNIIAIAAGQTHGIAVSADGTVWGWGDNGYGKLGDDTTVTRSTPVQVHGENNAGFLSNIVAVSAGQFHTVAMDRDGAVWAWGQNNFGRLGDNTDATRKTPVRVHGHGNVGFLTNVVAVVAGQRHNLAVDRDGLVWSWGCNQYGSIGDGTTEHRFTPVPVDTDADGLPDAWELAHFTNLDQTPGGDPDSDGLSNLQELQLGTDPNAADTDGDGVSDGAEVAAGTDPLNPASSPFHPVTVSGTLAYAGQQAGLFHVVAAPQADGWSGTACALAAPGAYAITGVTAPGTYWFKAWKDVNGNGARDALEPQGSYPSNPVALTGARAGIDITLSDPDTDGDGLSDYLETLYGTDPLTSNSFERLPFTEGFETNTCPALGELAGQHGWRAAPAGTCLVVTNPVYAGDRALDLAAADTESAARQIVAYGSASVWMDLRLQVNPSFVPTNACDEAAAFCVDDHGRICVQDGHLPADAPWVALTNHVPLVEGVWARFTVHLDYTSRTWLICLDGRLVAQGLGFGCVADRFSRFSVEGAMANLDNLTLSAGQPAGLSLEGDSLPDDWETQYFGNLDQTDGGDHDGDGLSNLDEFRAGTNPADADTDDDGMPDGSEIANGLDPLTDDAALDPDGDGLTDLQEYQLGTDPHNADTDGDGLTDGAEVNTWHTDPLAVDSDGDGYGDGVETARGFDPNSAASRPMSDWSHSLKLSVRANAVVETLRDVPVLVRLNSDRVDYAQFAAGGADLRFTDSASNPLDFEIDEWNPAGDSIVWIRIPELANTGAPGHVIMYWGNPAATNAANPAGVWRSYAGVWHLGETNQVFMDSAPDRHDAVNSGAVPAEGILGNARNFRGSDSILIPPLAFATISNAVTISFWQYGDAAQPSDGTCLEAASYAGRELNINLPLGDGNVYWDAFGDSDRIYKAAATNEYKGRWNHWTFTKDRDAHTMAIYLNGELWAATGSRKSAYTPVVSVGLGSAANGGSGYMGRMDEVRVETVARETAWNRFQCQAMLDQALIYGEQVVSVAGTGNAAEPDQAGEFTFTRASQSTNLPLLVNFTVAGTAVEGVDFAALPRMVVIPAGSLQATLSVPALDDIWLEGAETVTVSLADGDYFNPTNAAASIVIADNDQDTDSDGLCDEWEMQQFGDLAAAANGDADNDGLSNLGEYLHSTNPHSADTDGDGMPDGWEVANGLDPLTNDAALDPDGDGLTNLKEYQDGSNPRSADGDGDGMPDAWEILHGLNPADASDAALDPDNDGLTNLREYQAGTDLHNADTDGDGLTDGDEVNVWHTNPLNADTDGDGLPDEWEVQHALAPLNPFDAGRDADKDGLSNLQEYQAGTDPFNPDSDGDGVNDGEEAIESYTDPLLAEFDGTATDVAVVNGADAAAMLGNWSPSGTALISMGRRGYAEYAVSCAAADMYRIKVEATHLLLRNSCGPVQPVDASDLLLYVDGRYIGKKRLVAPEGIDGSVRVFTPWLQLGAHTIRVYWENVHTRVALKVERVRLQSLGGPDSNADGVKDWVAASVAAMTSLDRVNSAFYVGGGVSNAVWGTGWTNGGGTSVVSPVCIEGVDRYPDLMSIDVNGQTNIQALTGAGERWYADVPLSPTGTTAIAVSYQSGAITRGVNVTWAPLNLLAAGDLRIRAGDALLLTAHPAGATTGTVTIAVGTNQYATTVEAPVIHVFDTPGAYAVSGTYESGSNNTITVTVVGAAFTAETPACLLGRARSWTWAGLSSNAVVEADATVALTRNGTALGITMSKVNWNHYLVARLSTLSGGEGGAGGPVLARAKLNGFWIQAAVDSYLWVVEEYPDSALWQQELVAKAVPADVDIQLHIFVGGVTFDDLSIERWITATDLNELGEYNFRMIRPNSVRTSACHTIRAYQNGVYLGEAYYSGVLFPDE